MKIAVTTSGNTLDAPLDTRFGRAPRFLIYDTQTGTYEVMDNAQNLNAAQGAGIQSAQNVARSGASVLITGHCGPKAFKVLTAAKISIYCTAASTVQEALNLFSKGELKPEGAANVEGHWS